MKKEGRTEGLVLEHHHDLLNLGLEELRIGELLRLAEEGVDGCWLLARLGRGTGRNLLGWRWSGSSGRLEAR